MDAFSRIAHKKRFEPKLWAMFDRSRREHPEDSLLSWSILMEIDRLDDQGTFIFKALKDSKYL